MIVTVLATLVGSFAGAYLSAYFKKKGENLATHEDIDKLVDEVAAVTTTTKKIEAEISGDMWDRQKRWELKRDVLLQGARRMADTQAAILELEGVLKVETQSSSSQTPRDMSQHQEQALAKWTSAMSAADETALLASVVCGRDAGRLFANLNTLGEHVVKRILEKDTSAYRESCEEIAKKAGLVRDFIRRELGT